MRFRPRLAVTVAALAALLILLGLGTWQVQRLQWKKGLIAELEEANARPPVALPADFDPGAWRFRRVIVTGVPDPEHLFRLAAARDRRNGFRIFTPVHTIDGRTVFVDHGWLPETSHVSTPLFQSPDGRQVMIVGIVRLAGERPFPLMPASDPERNMWLYPDIHKMASHAGLPASDYYVQATEPVAGPGGPKPAEGRIELSNRHLEYALTWFALAAVLIVIYVVFSFRRTDDTDDRDNVRRL